MNIGVLRTAFVDKSYVSIPPEEMSIRKIKAMPETGDVHSMRLLRWTFEHLHD